MIKVRSKKKVKKSMKQQKENNKLFLFTMNDKFKHRYKKLNKLLKSYVPQSVTYLAHDKLEMLDNILDHGQLFLNLRIDYEFMEPNNCHENCCKLWDINRKYMNIVVGYAFCKKDSLWYQHTWLIDVDNILIETTYKFSAYYGYILSDNESIEFVKEIMKE